MNDWAQFRRFYNYKITQKQINLLRQHSQTLFNTDSTNQNHPSRLFHRQSTSDSNHSHPSYDNTLWQDEKDMLTSDGRSKKMKTHIRSVSFSSFQSTITHDGHDCNGYSLDSSKIQKSTVEEVQSATSMLDFDEIYSRRVLGFSSIDETYRWMSCAKLLYQIKELPMLITNAVDDPLITRKCHQVPEKYTGNQHEE